MPDLLDHPPSDQQGNHHSIPTGPVAVAVITPDGIYPNDNDYRRVYEAEVVGEVLAAAKHHLNLTHTEDWVAFVDNRPIDASKTFAENDLCGVVEIEWHKHEGGGGA